MSKKLTKFFTELRQKNIFFTQFDCQFIDVEPGKCKIHFMLDPTKLANMLGNIHGGAYMGISDCTMGVVGYSVGKKITTLDYNCNFIKTVPASETIKSIATIQHNGSRTVVILNNIYNKNDELLFTARGTFFVLGNFDLPKE